jgi:hypothetical protein
MLVVVLTAIFLSLILYADWIKKKIEKNIHDTEKRKRIFGKKNFIEGEWFNTTVVNSKKISEYAIIRIAYDGELGYKITGTLYCIKENKPKEIGTFNAIVQKYNECTRELDFSFKRQSIYEESKSYETHKLTTYIKNFHNEIFSIPEFQDIVCGKNEKQCSSSMASYGAGKYIFESYPHNEEPKKITGEFYDPERDESMRIIGKRIRTVKEIEGESKKRNHELQIVEDNYKNSDNTSTNEIKKVIEKSQEIKNKYRDIGNARLMHHIEEFRNKYGYANEDC